MILTLLESLPRFRGRDRLMWELGKRMPPGRQRVCKLPHGLRLHLALENAYERNLWLGMAHRRELEILRDLLQSGDHFVDVGANLGLWTLAAAGSVGPSGSVTSIEPNPITYERLCVNVSLNGFGPERVRTVNRGCSNHATELHFLCETEHYVSRFLADPTPGTCPVAVEPLDAILADQPPPDAIKIDVEGHELAVVEGMTAASLVHRPWIAVEFHGPYTGNPPLRDWSVARHLQEYGYRPYLLESWNGRRFTPAPPDSQPGLGEIELLFAIPDRHPFVVD